MGDPQGAAGTTPAPPTDPREQAIRRARAGLLLWASAIALFVVLVILDTPSRRRTAVAIVPTVLLNAALIVLGLRARRNLSAGDPRLAVGLVVAYGILATVAAGLFVGLGASFDGGAQTVVGGAVLLGSYVLAATTVSLAATRMKRDESGSGSGTSGRLRTGP